MSVSMPNDLEKIASAMEGLAVAIKKAGVSLKYAVMAISKFSVSSMYIALCPNRRVAHLAKYGKRRTRKKNINRAYKIHKNIGRHL